MSVDLSDLIEELSRSESPQLTLMASPVPSEASEESVEMRPEDLQWLEDVLENMFAAGRNPLEAITNQRPRARQQSLIRPSVARTYTNGRHTDVFDGAWNVLTREAHLPHVFRAVSMSPQAVTRPRRVAVYILRHDDGARLCLDVHDDKKRRRTCTKLSEKRTLSSGLHILNSRLKTKYDMKEYHPNLAVLRTLR